MIIVITLLVITTPVEGIILVTHVALMALSFIDGQKPRRLWQKARSSAWGASWLWAPEWAPLELGVQSVP